MLTECLHLDYLTASFIDFPFCCCLVVFSLLNVYFYIVGFRIFCFILECMNLPHLPWCYVWFVLWLAPFMCISYQLRIVCIGRPADRFATNSSQYTSFV